MSNKQTAVDFLMDKLFDPSMMVDEQVKWFEQAKEMEKEQIVNAFKEGVEIPYIEISFFCAKHYYELTYGGNI
jgi:hypothetical protein